MNEHYTSVEERKPLTFPEPKPTIQYDHPIGPEPQETKLKRFIKLFKSKATKENTVKVGLKAKETAIAISGGIKSFRDAMQDVRNAGGFSGGGQQQGEIIGTDNLGFPVYGKVKPKRKATRSKGVNMKSLKRNNYNSKTHGERDHDKWGNPIRVNSVTSEIEQYDGLDEMWQGTGKYKNSTKPKRKTKQKKDKELDPFDISGYF